MGVHMVHRLLKRLLNVLLGESYAQYLGFYGLW